MAGEWQNLSVGELADSISETHTMDKDRLIFLTTSDVLHGNILHHSYSEVRDWPEQAKKSIRRDDILFSEIRPVNGRWAYVDVDARDYVVSTKLMVIRAQKDRVLPRFLYHFLTSSKTTGWLQHLAESRSGTFPQITFDQVATLELALPSLGAQATIADFLDCITNKIELNQRMNETLEGIARALFKSWFVDFDPVRAKAEGREPVGMDAETAALFPDSFEDSELGLIPAGWAVRAIEQIAERVGIGPFGSSIKVASFVPSGIPVISGQHLNDVMLQDGVFNFVTHAHADKLRGANVYRGDVVFTHAGNIGQVAYIPDNSEYERYVLSQRQFYMRCDLTQVSPAFVSLYFRSAPGRHRLLANASQTGVPSISRPVTYLRSIKLPVPPRGVLDRFDAVIQTVHDVVRARAYEGATLASLRDTLLPRIISGRLRVPDGEKLLSESSV